MTSAWTAEHVRQIDLASASRIPEVTKIQRFGLEGGLIYWDMWPIQSVTGHVQPIDGRELWMVLTAPDAGEPLQRHFHAKIKLLERRGQHWLDLGYVLPSFAVDYDREWAGTALFDGDRISLFFTGAGQVDRPGGYQQRLYEAHARVGKDGLPCDWSKPVPSVSAKPAFYMPADAHEGEAGKIKAFRDPAFFHDPEDGEEYLVFSGSVADSPSDFNGAVGIAKRVGNSWELLPPLISADRVNNELERAHVVFHQGRYYAFWSTQTHTFSPELRHAPTGLYGMVADSLFGKYRPINDSGLILANPVNEPAQTYSWFVSSDLVVSSFVDFYGLKGKRVPFEQLDQNAVFAGVPAPLLKLEVSIDRCRLAESIFA